MAVSTIFTPGCWSVCRSSYLHCRREFHTLNDIIFSRRNSIMKRMIGGWLLAVILFPALVQAAIVEGKHYRTVPLPVAVETGTKVEVREIFWYGCPHCYVLEPGLMGWVKKLPAHAQFVRTPGTVSARWATHAQAYYTFETLGIMENVHGAFFKAVQEQKQGELNEEKGIADFAARHGVDRNKFSEAFNS